MISNDNRIRCDLPTNQSTNRYDFDILNRYRNRARYIYIYRCIYTIPIEKIVLNTISICYTLVRMIRTYTEAFCRALSAENKQGDTRGWMEGKNTVVIIRYTESSIFFTCICRNFRYDIQNATTTVALTSCMMWP